MSETPLVSIFIPYYNDKDFIADTIKSCLEQTYTNFELFLFNHASTDRSREIAHSFDDPRIRHVDAKENLGAGSGYNLKITLPKMNGKYVKLLCADDIMNPNCLEKMVAFLEKNPQKDIVFTNPDCIDNCGKKIGKKFSDYKQCAFYTLSETDLLERFFIRESVLPYSAALIKMSDLKQIHLEEYAIMLFDVSLWCQMIISGKKIGYIIDPLMLYRVSDTGISFSEMSQKPLQRSFFESGYLYFDLFSKIKDISIVKSLCRQSKYATKLENGDKDLIPFVIAQYFLLSVQIPEIFRSCHVALQVLGAQSLYNLFLDKEMRKRIEDKFGYNITVFRKDYGYIAKDVKKKDCIKLFGIKTKIPKQFKNISLFELILLLIRKLFLIIRNILFLSFLRKR